MSERYAEAYALTAEVQWAVGGERAALEAVNHAITFARAHGRTSWPARLIVARVLCNLGKLEEAEEALVALGYKPQEAQRVVRDVMSEGAASTEEIVRAALRHIAMRKEVSG